MVRSILLLDGVAWHCKHASSRVVFGDTSPGLRASRPDTFRDVARNPDAHAIPGLLIHRIDDELFFANAAFFARDVKERLIGSDTPATGLVNDLEGVSDIDTTAIQQFDELLDDLDAASVTVTIARVRRPVMDMLERSDVLDRIGQDAVFLEVDDAVEAFEGKGG